MIHIQNLNELEIAPSGQRYLHQNLSMIKLRTSTATREAIDIQSTISPLNPVATA